MNLSKVEEGMRLVLEGLEVDLSDHNFATTPQRAAKVFQEVFCPPPTRMAVFEEAYTDMVLMRGYVFHSFCAHHLLPIRLTATLAYLPNGRVLGASKLMRLIDDCNRKPTTQEMLTQSIIDHVRDLTSNTSLGEAIFLKGRHGCFEIRGVKANATMITTKFSGKFEQSSEMQRRFFEIISLGDGADK